MKEIFINVDSYNSEGIKTIQGNNNAEIYKIYVLENKRRLNLANKTIKLGYVMAGTTKGDIIENLNITNAEQGEITFPITNRISKQDGVYSCQLAIYGADEFLEYTATFGLTVEANIFTKIAGEIADSKDFTYLENILDKASKLSEKLKENTATATNANSNLESNITEANNINSKLLENTSTATSLNKNLESNIDLAKEVKETIKDLDTKNIEATEKIETLEGLNAKAEELSNNINQALPLNSELVKNVESAKAANTNLLAANQEATTKNTELQASLEKTKEFINGLDGSQNIPQIRMDVTELQNGLKSNQALEYQGSSISADNTLEGRTEGMRIGGRTLVNLVKYRLNNQKVGNPSLSATLCTNEMFKINTTYTIIYTINSIESGTGKTTLNFSGGMSVPDIILNSSNLVGTHKQTFTLSTMPSVTHRNVSLYHIDSNTTKFISDVIIIEGEVDFTLNYFEGIKSFGEAEGNKISTLSHGKNLLSERYRDKSLSILNIYRGVKYKQFLKESTEYTLSLKFKDDFILPKGCLLALSTTLNPNDGDFIVLMDSEGNVINNQIIKKSLKKSENLYLTFFNGKTIQTEDEYEDFINKIDYIQIEEGTQATSYEPYQSDKKDILIKEPLHEGNYLYEDNGQVKVYEKKKKYTFTGDEDWSTNSNVENEKTLYFYTNVLDNSIDKINTNNIVCNTLPTLSNYDSTCVTDSIFNTNGSNNIRIRISKSKLKSQDLEGFKAWLKANPTTVIYQLATPVVEVVENCVDIDLDTYQEKTYFSIENSLQGSLDFKVPSNLGSSLQNLAKEVNNIWDVINNLLVPGILDVNKKVALATIKNNLK